MERKEDTPVRKTRRKYEEKNKEICALAEQIKKDFYGNRIVMFAPLYLSN